MIIFGINSCTAMNLLYVPCLSVIYYITDLLGENIHMVYFQYGFIIFINLFKILFNTSFMISKLEIADILIASVNHSTFNYENIFHISSVQSLSHIRLCNPMGCSMLGFPVHHQLPELAQTHADKCQACLLQRGQVSYSLAQILAQTLLFYFHLAHLSVPKILQDTK